MNELREIGKTWFGGKPPSPKRRVSLPVNSYSSNKHSSSSNHHLPKHQHSNSNSLSPTSSTSTLSQSRHSNSRRPSHVATKVQRNVTICGPMGVGKTSICKVLCDPKNAVQINSAKNTYQPTIEDEFVVNTKIEDDEGVCKNVQLTILDTMGNDNPNMGNLCPDKFVTNKDGFIVVYDVTCSKSFRFATDFLDKLINDNNIDPEDKAILLVGNKTDKKDDPDKIKEIEEENKRKMQEEDYFDDEDLGIVDDQDARDFCEDNYGLLDPLFISATKSSDVAKVFNTLCNHIEFLKSS